MSNKNLLIATLASTSMIAAGSAQAVLINMDFGKGPALDGNGFGSGASVVHTGDAVLGAGSMFWNDTDTEDDVFETDLLDSTGASTGVGLRWSPEAQSSVNDGAIEFGSTGHNALMEDYAFTAGGTTATYTLSGLNPGDAYTFVLFGVPDGEFQDTVFAVTGANEGAQAVTAGNVADDNGLASPDDYVTFTGTVDGTGTVVWTQTSFSGQQGGFSGSNGFQIDVVPEPSSLALLGLGGLLAARRRRG